MRPTLSVVTLTIAIVHLAAIVAQTGLILFGLYRCVRNIEALSDGFGGHASLVQHRSLARAVGVR